MRRSPPGAQRRSDRLRGLVARFRHRPRPLPGAQRQAAVVEVRPRRRRALRRARHDRQRMVGLVAVRHGQARQARLRDAEAARGGQADRLPQARRQGLVRQAVVGLSLQHQSRGGPAGPPAAARPGGSDSRQPAPLRRAGAALLPGRRLRGRLRRRSQPSSIRASSSTRRTASTAKPATSRTRRRTSTGRRRKAAADRTIRTCERRPSAARNRHVCRRRFLL
jgi:hypothetical protein